MKKLKILPFAISVVIIAAIIFFSNPYQIYLSITKVNKLFIAVALGFSVLNVLLRVLKWKVFIEGVRFFELFPVQIFGMTLSNFTPGKIAEPAKSVVLRAVSGIPVSVSLPTVIWERINDIIAVIIFSFVAIQALSIKSNLFVIAVLSMAAFIVLISLLVVMMRSRRFGNRIFGILKRLPGTKSISEKFIENFYSIEIKKRKIAASFAVTLVAWMVEGIIFYLVLLSMGISSDFVLLAGIVCLSALIGIASSLPGGIGSSEIVMIFLIGLTGVAGSVAVSAVFIYRIMTFWFGAFIGGLSFIYLSRKVDMKNLKFE